MEKGNFQLFQSRIFRFTAELRDMVNMKAIREDVAEKAVAILNGKESVDEESPPPVPWSDDAKNQAKQYTWEQQYKSEKENYEFQATPFEKLLDKYY